MIQPLRAWRIEQGDRRLAFASGHGVTVFAESGAAAVTRHRHPAWKVVLPVGGQVTVGALCAAGMLVPPQLAHTCATSSPFVAVFLDPWRVRRGPGLTRLQPSTVRRLLDALGAELDLAAVSQELAAITGPAPAVDPRVAHALDHCGQATRLDTLAAEVGVSPPRLRALVHDTVGIPLTRLRQWQRLRTAVAALPGGPIATVAAEAGFADQAHLTRSARRLIGRTPASLRPRDQLPRPGAHRRPAPPAPTRESG